MQNPSMHISP